MLIDTDEKTHGLVKRLCNAMIPQASLHLFSDPRAAFKKLERLAQGSEPGISLPDIVLMEYHIGKTNALTVMDQLVRQDLFSGKPLSCFVLSYSQEASEMDAALRHPCCSAYFSKPLDPDKFAEILNAHAITFGRQAE